MTFNDLPDGWEQRPMTDPAVFDDVVDLVVSERDRWSGALYLLLCDRDGRLIQPCAITDLPPGCQQDPRAIEPFVAALMQHLPGAGLVLVVARPGVPVPQETDVQWMRTAEATCDRANARLLASAVATPAGVFRLSAHDPKTCV